MSKKPIEYSELAKADLVVDQLYRGGPGLKGEPLTNLVGGTVNVGGFRHSKPKGQERPLYCMLVMTNKNPAWPNKLDQESGVFTYYGDNISAGRDLHGSKGNQILRDSFEAATCGKWNQVPLFIIFEQSGKNAYIFRGLAVPGSPAGVSEGDLVAVWKSDSSGRRFQNYRATFTVLDTGPVAISRNWLDEIKSKHVISGENANQAWLNYSRKGVVKALKAIPTFRPRTSVEQGPSNPVEKDVLETIVAHHKALGKTGNYVFENTANRICELMLAGNSRIQGTKKSGDGGYDGHGKLKIGTNESSVSLPFLVEAKLYKGDCGVSLTKRLISRLKTQAFGIFVTTSSVGKKAQLEMMHDGQPVIILGGGDIAKILIRSGISTPDLVKSWLTKTD